MIEFVNVSKTYPDKTAVKNINFEIAEGEFLFLVGPSGSGKTSIIKLLIREEKPSEGSIFFYENEVTTLSQAEITQLRREVGVVFQDFKLLPHKNIFENISFILEVSGKKPQDIEETVPYVLKLVNLEDRAEAFPRHLSGGEKQRIAIARAIANNPKVLIADEPTGNLDPEASWEIIDLLKKINEWGTTVIMATHGSDLVDTLGKRVIQLENGTVIADNKKGFYPQKPIKLPINQQKDTKKEDKKKTKEKKKKQKKDKKEEIKTEAEKKQKSEEKKKHDADKKVKESETIEKENSEDKNEIDSNTDEFEITFTTKQNVKTDKKQKSKKRRKGKDVVDLHKLQLPTKIEEILIKKGHNQIRKLKNLSDEKLESIKGIGSDSVKKIQSALEKYDKV